MELDFKIAKAVEVYIVSKSGGAFIPNMDELKEVIKKQLPTEQDKAIEAASHYLCDDDVEAAIKIIAEHPDQSDYIDMVDGVTVWEKVHMQFTCEQFLEHINWTE